MLTMTERPKITVDLPERSRRALLLYATQFGMTLSEALERMVEERLPDYLELADKGIAAGTNPPKPKRGRKPKPRD